MSPTAADPVAVGQYGFKKGQSGNPGGRPRGAKEMARLIREATHDGKELVEHALTVFRDPKASIPDRRWAIEWLADRGFGKAMQTIELGEPGTFEDELDLSRCTPEQLDALATLPIAGEAHLPEPRTPDAAGAAVATGEPDAPTPEG